MKKRLLRLKSWHGQDWTKVVRYDRLIVEPTPKINLDYKVKGVSICKSKCKSSKSSKSGTCVHALAGDITWIAKHLPYQKCRM